MTTDSTIEKKPFKVNLSLIVVVGTFIATSAFRVGGRRVTKDQPVNTKLADLSVKLDTFNVKVDQINGALQTITDNQKQINDTLMSKIDANGYRLEMLEGVVIPPQ